MHQITKITGYIAIILIVLSFNFFLPRLMPGDPLSFLTGDPSMDMPIVLDEEARARLLAYYGLDKPLLQQFTDYMHNILHGDLGWSIYFNAPVSEILIGRLKWTLLLLGTATALYMSLGILLGAISAWNRGKKRDVGLLVSLLSVGSFPPFFLGMLLIILFGVNLQLFPIFGAQTPFMRYSSPLDEASDILYHLVLPVTTLVICYIGDVYLLMRNSMLNVIGEDYIVTARAKGLSEWYILRKHAMKNALLPITTMIALRVGFMISGMIFVETVFAYPGVGRLLFDAVTYRDYPLLQGAFLVITLVIIAANFVADMIYVRLDPRLQHN
jgi:peptide/nickel transport system permease protein